MVIGGQAVLIYGRPRFTRDIDVTLGIDVEDFALLEKVCKKLKLRILPENPEDFANQTRVLPTEEPNSGIRVDFVFSFSEYERQAIKKAKGVDISNYPVKFASCEDVVIQKMIAGRAIDEEDVKSILIRNKSSIELKYVKKWLSEFNKISEYKGVLKRFDNLLNEYGK
jgi:hypothetical protein